MCARRRAPTAVAACGGLFIFSALGSRASPGPVRVPRAAHAIRFSKHSLAMCGKHARMRVRGAAARGEAPALHALHRWLTQSAKVLGLRRAKLAAALMLVSGTVRSASLVSFLAPSTNLSWALLHRCSCCWDL